MSTVTKESICIVYERHNLTGEGEETGVDLSDFVK